MVGRDEVWYCLRHQVDYDPASGFQALFTMESATATHGRFVKSPHATPEALAMFRAGLLKARKDVID